MGDDAPPASRGHVAVQTAGQQHHTGGDHGSDATRGDRTSSGLVCGSRIWVLSFTGKPWLCVAPFDRRAVAGQICSGRCSLPHCESSELTVLPVSRRSNAPSSLASLISSFDRCGAVWSLLLPESATGRRAEQEWATQTDRKRKQKKKRKRKQKTKKNGPRTTSGLRPSHHDACT